VNVSEGKQWPKSGRTGTAAFARRIPQPLILRTAALRHKLPVTILAQGCRDSPTSIVQLKSQYRTVRDRASEAPHQFRTRNNLIRTQRTRSKSNKNAAKSTKLIDILPLITVWLQVRVLPGPPVISSSWRNFQFWSGPFSGPVAPCAHQSTRADHPSRVFGDGARRVSVYYEPSAFGTYCELKLSLALIVPLGCANLSKPSRWLRVTTPVSVRC
jgi:hypothetical protein